MRTFTFCMSSHFFCTYIDREVNVSYGKENLLQSEIKMFSL